MFDCEFQTGTVAKFLSDHGLGPTEVGGYPFRAFQRNRRLRLPIP